MTTEDATPRRSRGSTTPRGRSRYHSISPHRPNDPRLRASTSTDHAAASLEAHWLWGQLLTCDLVTMPGMVKGGPGALAEVTRRPVELIRSALAELTHRGMVEVDEDACLIRLVGTLIDHVRPMESGNTLKGFFSILRNLPSSPLVLAHAQEIASVFRRDGDGEIRTIVRQLIDQLLLVHEREHEREPGRRAVLPREVVTAATPLVEALAKGLPTSDQDPDPDPDPDHNSPLVPQGGNQDEEGEDEESDAAAAANDGSEDDSPYAAIITALDRGRVALGMPGPAPPFDDNTRRKLRRFAATRGQAGLAALPRAIERWVVHLRSQRADRRHEFNLPAVLRQYDMLASATHLDRPRAGPLTMLASPAALLVHATGGAH